jgi:hypothetical protein
MKPFSVASSKFNINKFLLIMSIVSSEKENILFHCDGHITEAEIMRVGTVL